MYITISLPVSLPIKKFLTTKFGKDYKPNQQEWFGILICSLLEKKTISHWENRQKQEDFPEVYDIKISLSYCDKHGIYISAAHERLLRKSLESVFRENLYEQAILNKECYGIDYKTTFKNILEFYGTDANDSSYYQTLIRDFNRKKEAIQKRLDKK